MAPKVYIIILNYNGWEDTIECLESVLRLDYSNFQVIVIDNNSPNDSMTFISRWADGEMSLWNGNSNPLQHIFVPLLQTPVDYQYFNYKDTSLEELGLIKHKLTLLQAGANNGFAAGNNIFLRAILEKDAYVWLLNPDMVIEKNSLKNLISCTGKDNKNVVFGTIIRDYLKPNKLLIYGGGKHNPFSGTITFIQDKRQAHLIDYIHGGSFFTHISNFKNIGLLPEDYFLYGEESDWCYQARKQNVKLAICESAICYDKVSTSIGKGYMAEYYYTLNSLKFYRKYNKKFIPFILFSNGLRIFKRLLYLETDRVRAILKASWKFALSNRK